MRLLKCDSNGVAGKSDLRSGICGRLHPKPYPTTTLSGAMAIAERFNSMQSLQQLWLSILFNKTKCKQTQITQLAIMQSTAVQLHTIHFNLIQSHLQQQYNRAFVNACIRGSWTTRFCCQSTAPCNLPGFTANKRRRQTHSSKGCSSECRSDARKAGW